jgi:hypothetical protein
VALFTTPSTTPGLPAQTALAQRTAASKPANLTTERMDQSPCELHLKIEQTCTSKRLPGKNDCDREISRFPVLTQSAYNVNRRE